MENDKVEIKSFIFKITREQAEEILDNEKDKPPTRIGLICVHGAIIPDTAEIIVELGEDGTCYVASVDMLARGEDGIFCYLKHDVNEAVGYIPNFKDIFKMIKL